MIPDSVTARPASITQILTIARNAREGMARTFMIEAAFDVRLSTQIVYLASIILMFHPDRVALSARGTKLSALAVKNARGAKSSRMTPTASPATLVMSAVSV